MKSFTRLFIGCGALIGAALVVWGYRAWQEKARHPHPATLVEAENARLKILVSSLRDGVCVEEEEGEELKARVFAEYPWNDRGALIVNKGEADGVAVGQTVLDPGGFLLGKVRTVRRHTAEVETIFDGTWRSSVAIGASAKAVLTGGKTPGLGLIPRDGNVTEGMSVTNTSPDFPLGQPVGTVSSLRTRDGVWIEGTLAAPYALSEVDEVKILTDFP